VRGFVRARGAGGRLGEGEVGPAPADCRVARVPVARRPFRGPRTGATGRRSFRAPPVPAGVAPRATARGGAARRRTARRRGSRDRRRRASAVETRVRRVYAGQTAARDREVDLLAITEQSDLSIPRRALAPLRFRVPFAAAVRQRPSRSEPARMAPCAADGEPRRAGGRLGEEGVGTGVAGLPRREVDLLAIAEQTDPSIPRRALSAHLLPHPFAAAVRVRERPTSRPERRAINPRHPRPAAPRPAPLPPSPGCATPAGPGRRA